LFFLDAATDVPVAAKEAISAEAANTLIILPMTISSD
jgi:hypothetical protein